MSDSIYRAQLLEHYRHPRHKGDPSGSALIKDGINANCGDQIRLGLTLHSGTVSAIRYQIRACAICTASASIMSELFEQQSTESVLKKIEAFKKAVKTNQDWPEGTEPLSGAGVSINRHRCLTLPWETCEALLLENASDND